MVVDKLRNPDAAEQVQPVANQRSRKMLLPGLLRQASRHARHRGNSTRLEEEKVLRSLYRPFCKKWLFFDRILNERVYQFSRILPKISTQNSVICVAGIGSNKQFHCLIANTIPDIHLTGDTQCLPHYTYVEDGSNQRENITDWSLQQFQQQYGPQVTKWNIFNDVYGMLHLPDYRERYIDDITSPKNYSSFSHNSILLTP